MKRYQHPDPRMAKPQAIRTGAGARVILPNNWLYRSNGLGFTSIPDADTVVEGCECPGCGEDRVDTLGWLTDDVVECQSCGAHYDPNEV